MLPMTTLDHVLWIAQESLTNVLKHGSATRIRIELVANVRSLQLDISDNGTGFRFSKTGMSGGFGLKGMKERANLIGGRLSTSRRAGCGMHVRLTVPVESPRKNGSRTA